MKTESVKKNIPIDNDVKCGDKILFAGLSWKVAPGYNDGFVYLYSNDTSKLKCTIDFLKNNNAIYLKKKV